MPPQFSCVPLRSTSENCAVLPCFSDFGYFPTAHFLTFPKALYAEYRQAQADMRQAVAVKANIDHLLGVTDGRENKAQER